MQMQMKCSLGMLRRPHGDGGNGQGRHRGGPTEDGGTMELPSLPLTHFSSLALAARPQALAQGDPGCQMAAVPLPGAGESPQSCALLCFHSTRDGWAMPGGSWLGSRPGADLLAAPGSSILHAAALAPAACCCGPCHTQHPHPIPRPPGVTGAREHCGPQCPRGSRWGDDPICPPSPAPRSRGTHLLWVPCSSHRAPCGAAAWDVLQEQGCEQTAPVEPIPSICWGNVSVFRPGAQLRSAQDGANRSLPPRGCLRGSPLAQPIRLQWPHTVQGTVLWGHRQVGAHPWHPPALQSARGGDRRHSNGAGSFPGASLKAGGGAAPPKPARARGRM